MIKQWLDKLKVTLKARRIAKEIYGSGKSQKGQCQVCCGHFNSSSETGHSYFFQLS